MVGELTQGTLTWSMGCGTGLVFQSAKLVKDIVPRSGGGGIWANARVACPPQSSPAGVAVPDSRRVVSMFSLAVAWFSTKLRLMAPGSK